MMHESAENELVEILKRIVDPRGSRGRRFSSFSMLSICILATLSGAMSLRAIAQWASQLSVFELKRLGIRRSKAPSESAIRRFLARVDPDEVDRLIGTWMMKQSKSAEAIAIDGKILRGTRKPGGKQDHLLSAVLQEAGLTVSQVKVAEGSSEIAAVKPLLDRIQVQGRVVTLDALHTQKDTARYISEEKKADYLMTVKANQAGLMDQIETAGMLSFSPSVLSRPRTTRRIPRVTQIRSDRHRLDRRLPSGQLCPIGSAQTGLRVDQPKHSRRCRRVFPNRKS